MVIIPELTGHATIPAGSIHLGNYPGLTHAPQQHGEGIRFAHNGKPVELVVEEGIGIEARYIRDIADTAEAIGVSFGDVLDALKYLHDTKAI